MRRRVTGEPGGLDYNKLAFLTRLTGGIVSLVLIGYAIFWAVSVRGGIYVSIVLVIVSGISWVIFSKMAYKLKEAGGRRR
jgi:hypothetical protein